MPGCGVRPILRCCILPAARFLCVLTALFPWASGLGAQAPGPASTPSLDDFQRTVRQSGVIFDGTVTTVECEVGKNKLPQTYRVRFQVKQGVRGVGEASTFVLREWAGLWTAGRPPRYWVGERVVLFLYPPSRAGLTSPVGGTKGKLPVVADAIHGSQVLLPSDWLAGVGPPPAASSAGTGKSPSAKTSPIQSTRVPVAWLVQRIAQAGAAPSGGE